MLDYIEFGAFLVVNNPPANAGYMGSILMSERKKKRKKDTLKKKMVTHLSMLAWKNPWIEEPSGYSP